MALLIVGEMLVSVALVVLVQQKIVDLVRRMNPEKQVSVYDSKFQKKWYNTCDEAERAQIGQASYQAFQAANRAALPCGWCFCCSAMSFPSAFCPWRRCCSSGLCCR